MKTISLYWTLNNQLYLLNLNVFAYVSKRDTTNPNVISQAVYSPGPFPVVQHLAKIGFHSFNIRVYNFIALSNSMLP